MGTVTVTTSPTTLDAATASTIDIVDNRGPSPVTLSTGKVLLPAKAMQVPVTAGTPLTATVATGAPSSTVIVSVQPGSQDTDSSGIADGKIGFADLGVDVLPKLVTNLNATYAGIDADRLVSARTTMRRGAVPGIISLICGSDDETWSGAANCAVTSDTTNYKVNGTGWLFTSTASGHMSAYVDPIPPGTPDPLTCNPQAVCMWVYIPDATKVTAATIYLHTDSALTTPNRWSRDTSIAAYPGAQTLVNGWNLIRVPANFNAQQLATWGTFYRLTIDFNTTAASAQATIGQVWFEQPRKARLLIVQDGAYRGFFGSPVGGSASAYGKLKSRGYPVTIAVDYSGKFGTGIGGQFEVITEAELDTLAHENGNSVSIHSWDGTVTSGMTAAQLRADTAKAVKYAARKGYGGRIWRAAFVQNNAPQWAAVRGLVVAAAEATTAGTGRANCWPPFDLMRISRHAIDNDTYSGRYQANDYTAIDARFTWLQASRMLDVPFFHGISSAQFDTDSAMFDYWLAKVDAAVAAGWLECVTFEEMYYESGGQFGRLSGGAYAEYLNPDGTLAAKALP